MTPPRVSRSGGLARVLSDAFGHSLLAVGGLLVAAVLQVSCGSSAPWSAEPSPDYDEEVEGEFVPPTERERLLIEHYRVRHIGGTRPENPVERPEVVEERIAISRTEGNVVGPFRNTYYDFPSETAFTGATTSLFDTTCRPIAEVKTAFFDKLCVQGSGVLSSGIPVSFARRDCECARICPATKQKICFEALNSKTYPWGRGASGKAITPLLSIAVDTSVIPMGASVYIPQYEGIPVDREQSGFHDGCFIAQDRGLAVKGKHVDIFTGEPSITRLWNQLVPSNKGVTVVLNSPKCARAH